MYPSLYTQKKFQVNKYKFLTPPGNPKKPFTINFQEMPTIHSHTSAAKCNGVCPLSSRAFGFAPKFSSVWLTANCPYLAAKCNAVWLFSVIASRLAPWSCTNTLTTLTCPFCAAKCNGASPFLDLLKIQCMTVWLIKVKLFKFKIFLKSLSKKLISKAICA